MPGRIEARLAELKIELPKAAAPAANYVPWTISGKTLYVAGQIPFWNGELKFVGRVGEAMTLEQGQQAARLCALNIIAQAKVACGGDLDRVARVLKLTGYVNCVASFTDQPKVINGASDLMVQVFGDAGKHARAAVGVNVLPLGVTTEVDAIIELA
ncbi:MAG: RidA family protein [Alphaproteobacteria bacterium]|nr:RidA family protein [Alphaproteobacteria bacterium]